MPYIGAPLITTNFPVDTFTATPGQTVFNLSLSPATVNSVLVLVNGVAQQPTSAYTLSGSTLTLTSGLNGGDTVWALHLGVRGTLNAPADGSVTSASVDSTVGFTAQRVYTSNSTWTKPANLKRIRVRVWGGGASGGAGNSTSSTRGTGGGGGGYSERVIAAAGLGATETVTVGAGGAAVAASATPPNGNPGGTSSFGSWCSATGGAAGAAANGSAQGGSAGGTGSSGDINATGQSSQLNSSGNSTSCSSGGNAAFGGGVGGVANIGDNGQLPGGGGACGNHTITLLSGAGAGGIVIVEEFY